MKFNFYKSESNIWMLNLISVRKSDVMLDIII